jgi:myo-inositol-1(or 4)-monophosphatase
MGLEHRLQVTERLTASAAKIALGHFQNLSSLAVTVKHPQDLVSGADLEVEQYLRAQLALEFPGEAILGEEMGGDLQGHGWVIDPVDGTANFVSGSPLWGISIAYVQGDESLVGAVAYPALGYTLSAAKGYGLRRNGASAVRHLQRSGLKVAAIGENVHWRAEHIGDLELQFRKAGWGVAGYRCATIGLGFTALGCTSGYVERYTSLWDVAAGRLLCSEAGLQISTQGLDVQAGLTVVAGTQELYDLAHHALSACLT